MKQCELTVLCHKEYEANPQFVLDKVEHIIKNAGGRIISSENEGKKHLAYPILGEEYALYYFFVVELPIEEVHTVETALNLADWEMRHLLVAVDAFRNTPKKTAFREVKDRMKRLYRESNLSYKDMRECIDELYEELLQQVKEMEKEGE